MSDNAYYVPGAPEDLKKDHIVRAEGLGGLVKCLCVSTKTVCETARVMHQMSPAATAALGRFMTGSLLISESMKNDIEIGLKYFERVCVNIMVENTAPLQPSNEVREIFMKEIYPIYKDNPRIDILLHNTDFGVGGTK